MFGIGTGGRGRVRPRRIWMDEVVETRGRQGGVER